MTSITHESIIQRKNEQVLLSELGDEIVMMDIENGNYISLDKIGKVIWEQLENPVSLQALIQYLTNRFNVGEEACTKDCLLYLEQLLEQNLIRLI